MSASKSKEVGFGDYYQHLFHIFAIAKVLSNHRRLFLKCVYATYNDIPSAEFKGMIDIWNASKNPKAQDIKRSITPHMRALRKVHHEKPNSQHATDEWITDSLRNWAMEGFDIHDDL